MAGDLAPWTTEVRLLAEVLNATRTTAWLLSADAQAKQPKQRPEPIRPPQPGQGGGERLGSAHMTLDETKEWLGW